MGFTVLAAAPLEDVFASATASLSAIALSLRTVPPSIFPPAAPPTITPPWDPVCLGLEAAWCWLPLLLPLLLVRCSPLHSPCSRGTMSEMFETSDPLEEAGEELLLLFELWGMIIPPVAEEGLSLLPPLPWLRALELPTAFCLDTPPACVGL